LRHAIDVVDKMSIRLKPNCGGKRTSFAYTRARNAAFWCALYCFTQFRLH